MFSIFNLIFNALQKLKTIEEIEKEKRQMMEHIWELLNDPSVPREKVEEIALERVDNMSRLLFEAFDTHYVGLAQLEEGAESEQSSWSLMTVNFRVKSF